MQSSGSINERGYFCPESTCSISSSSNLHNLSSHHHHPNLHHHQPQHHETNSNVYTTNSLNSMTYGSNNFSDNLSPLSPNHRNSLNLSHHTASQPQHHQHNHLSSFNKYPQNSNSSQANFVNQLSQQPPTTQSQPTGPNLPNGPYSDQHYSNANNINYRHDEMSSNQSYTSHLTSNGNSSANIFRNMNSSRPTSGYDSFNGMDSIDPLNLNRPSSGAWSESIIRHSMTTTGNNTPCTNSSQIHTLSGNSINQMLTPDGRHHLQSHNSLHTASGHNSIISSHHQNLNSTSTTQNLYYNGMEHYNTTASSHSGQNILPHSNNSQGQYHHTCFSNSSSASVATNLANLSTQSRPASGYEDICDTFDSGFNFARPQAPNMGPGSAFGMPGSFMPSMNHLDAMSNHNAYLQNAYYKYHYGENKINNTDNNLPPPYSRQGNNNLPKMPNGQPPPPTYLANNLQGQAANANRDMVTCSSNKSEYGNFSDSAGMSALATQNSTECHSGQCEKEISQQLEMLMLRNQNQVPNTEESEEVKSHTMKKKSKEKNLKIDEISSINDSGLCKTMGTPSTNISSKLDFQKELVEEVPKMGEKTSLHNPRVTASEFSDTFLKPIFFRSEPEKSKDKEKRKKSKMIKQTGPQRIVTPISKVKSSWYRFFIEQHMENMDKERRKRRDRLLNLEQEMSKKNFQADEREQIRAVQHTKESQCLRRKRQKLSTSDFTWIKTLGVGAFGEVALAIQNETDEIFAIKKLKKLEIKRKKQTAHVKAERDILAEADTPWIPKLWYSFQDSDHLYFVTEYIPGGDLMSLLIKMEIFSEMMGKFYVAEMVLALEYVHRIGYIHRDIKPDNILIDRSGHIKLADFGLCTGFRWTHDSYYYNDPNAQAPERKNIEWHVQASTAWRQDGEMSPTSTNVPIQHGEKSKKLGKPDLGQIKEDSSEDENNKNRTISQEVILERDKASEHVIKYSLVGTPNYIAPEVLKQEGYTQNCDWWSVGVILYEMVIGMPPFYAQSSIETQRKIINYKKTFKIPPKPRISNACKHIINSWICDQNQRLSCIHEIKQHDWFKTSIDKRTRQVIEHKFDWDNLRNTPAPYIPRITNEYDTTNFDEIPNDPYMMQHANGGTGVGGGGAGGAEANNDNSWMRNNNQKSKSNNELYDAAPYFDDFSYKRIDMKDIYNEWRQQQQQ